MLVLGITNSIQNKLFIYFWEYDNVTEYNALEEANFLSQIFGIDIYISESSPNHYHAVSFDLLSKTTINRVQMYSAEGDYIPLSETTLWDSRVIRKPYNALRIGVKGKKAEPKFVKVFYHEGNEHLKSLGHLKIFQKLCGFPELPPHLKKFAVNTSVQICVYNTGIGAKPKWRLKE